MAESTRLSSSVRQRRADQRVKFSKFYRQKFLSSGWLASILFLLILGSPQVGAIQSRFKHDVLSMSQLRHRRPFLVGRGGAVVSSTAAAIPTESDEETTRTSMTTAPQPPPPSYSTLNQTSAKVEAVSLPDSTPPTVSTSIDDQHTKRILMLIRVLFLAYYGSLGSLLPYLPVYYHSLGHGGLIIGMLGAVKPLTTFLVAPFWGILSDRSGNHFGILYFTFLVSCIGQLLVAVRHDVHYLMTMVFITALFNAPVKSLIDSMVMDHLTDKKQYGKLRLWGQLGFGLGSSAVGVLLSKSKQRAAEAAAETAAILGEEALSPTTTSTRAAQVLYEFWQNLTGYRLLFFTYAALSLPTWLCLKTFERMDREKAAAHMESSTTTAGTAEDSKGKGNKNEGAHILEGLRLLCHHGDAMLFFFLVFVVGVSSGIIENFAYVRMREVGGSGKEMGLSRLVSSAAGAPMFWFSGPLTEKLGADRVLVVSLLSYVTRFLIYALMRNPYHGLPAEALRGVTFAAFWSTGTVYAHRISPPGMGATMLMFLNAMYGGLGQSLGAIIGGKLQSHIGTVKTFVYSGLFDLCFVGFVVLYLGMRKDSSFRNPEPIRPRENNLDELKAEPEMLREESIKSMTESTDRSTSTAGKVNPDRGQYTNEKMNTLR